MEKRDIEELIKISVVDVPGNMVINGIPQMMKAKVLVCPNCNNVLTQLPDVSYMEICSICNSEQDKLPKYCPYCGQKLSYTREVVAVCEGEDAKV